ncbi:Superinfection immunity protein [compost metagenome]
MFIIRLLVLLFLVAYSWSMGQIPASGLNGFGKLISMLFFLVAPLLYLLPTIEAILKKHRRVVPIALVNVLLGWSLIGWVVAYVWSFIPVEDKISVAPSTPQPAEEKQPAQAKLCPFCAEEIMAAAIKCKHCGSALT